MKLWEKHLIESQNITPGNIKKVAQQVLPAEDIQTYESDLYIKVSDKSTELLSRMSDRDSGLLTKFRSPVDGCLWYDIPFGNMEDHINSKDDIQESKPTITGDIKVGDKFKGRVDGSIFTVTAIYPNKDKIEYEVNDKSYITGLSHFRHTLLDRVSKNTVTESKVDNYTLNQIKSVLDSSGDNFYIKISNQDVEVSTKFLSIDRQDLENIYRSLSGNNNDLIKLPSEQDSEGTSKFIQKQLDKSYNRKYESRPDKEAARSRMFSDSRRKLKMPDKFKNIDEIVSYLEKCEDQVDVMNVNTRVGGFNRQLHNDMLEFANQFIKENGYLDSYIDKNGNEQEGSFKKFKQEMINFVKNYNIKTESLKYQKIVENVIEDGDSYFKLELNTSNIAPEGDPNFEKEVGKILLPVINNLQYTQNVPITDNKGNVIGRYGFGLEDVVDALD